MSVGRSGTRHAARWPTQMLRCPARWRFKAPVAERTTRGCVRRTWGSAPGCHYSRRRRPPTGSASTFGRYFLVVGKPGEHHVFAVSSSIKATHRDQERHVATGSRANQTSGRDAACVDVPVSADEGELKAARLLARLTGAAQERPAGWDPRASPPTVSPLEGRGRR